MKKGDLVVHDPKYSLPESFCEQCMAPSTEVPNRPVRRGDDTLASCTRCVPLRDWEEGLFSHLQVEDHALIPYEATA